MIKVALKGLLARKFRLLATSLSVVLGVAFVTGTLLLSSSLTSSITDVVSLGDKGLSVLVRSTTKIPDDGGGSGERRLRVPASVVEQVGKVDGVRIAGGAIAANAIPIDKNNKRIGSSFGPPTIIQNWNDDFAISGLKVTSGHAPTASGEVLVSFKTATDANLAIGDTIRMASGTSASDAPTPFTIVGMGGVGPDGTEATTATVFELTTQDVQKLAGVTDEFDAVRVAAEDGVSQGELRDRIADALPAATEAVTGQTYIDEQVDQISSGLSQFTTFIVAFGYIALFVGAFVIYNTFSIVTAQRTREVALLRAIGANRRQVLGSILIEAVITGFLGGLIGVALGQLIAIGLGGLLDIDQIDGLTPGIVIQGLLLAIIITMISALLPAIRATRVPPIAALGELGVDRSGLSTSRKVFGSLFLLGGIALVAAADLEAFDSPLTWVAVGAGMLMVSVVVIGPVFAGPLARLIGAPVRAVYAMPGKLASDNASRNPKRTITTAVALTIGVTLIMIIAVLASSIKGLLDTANTTGFARLDAIVSSDDFNAGFSPSLAEKLKALPEVGSLAELRLTQLRLVNGTAADDARKADGTEKDGIPVGVDDLVAGIDPSTYLPLIDLGAETPPDPTIGNDEVLVRQKFASDNGWKLGDVVEAYTAPTFPTSGIQKWKIVGFFENQVGPQAMYLNLDTFTRNAVPASNVDRTLFVKAEAGTSPDQLRSALSSAVADNPLAQVTSVADFAEQQTQLFDLFLTFIYALLSLAVIIAVIGLVNALSLSVFERTREIGLLRAVGMDRVQLRKAIRWESAIVSVLGTALGLIIGIALAVSFVYALGDSQLKPVLPTTTIVVIVVLGILAGVIAAAWPAWRASSKDVLSAIGSS